MTESQAIATMFASGNTKSAPKSSNETTNKDNDSSYLETQKQADKAYKPVRETKSQDTTVDNSVEHSTHSAPSFTEIVDKTGVAIENIPTDPVMVGVLNQSEFIDNRSTSDVGLTVGTTEVEASAVDVVSGELTTFLQPTEVLSLLEKNINDNSFIGLTHVSALPELKDINLSAVKVPLSADNNIIQPSLQSGLRTIMDKFGPVSIENITFNEDSLELRADSSVSKIINTTVSNQTSTSTITTPISTTAVIVSQVVDSNSPGLTITTPVNQSKWGEAVAERVMWMSAKGIREATIQLDPPELGPLNVKVSVQQDQAQVSFVVQHAATREALDQTLIRLKEMFSEQGLNLVNVDVSDQSSSEQQHAENNQSDDWQSSQQEPSVPESQTLIKNHYLIDSYI